MSENTLPHSVECGMTVQFFNFQEPLSKLKTLLEGAWRVSLSGRSFWLQDTVQLDEDKNLIEHGIYGEGAVEIKLRLKMKNGVEIIEIVDVSKPTAEQVTLNRSADNIDQCTQWVESEEFKLERVRRNMPDSLEEWTVDDVKCWIDWAVKEFQLTNVDSNAWRITGRDLKEMTNQVYGKLIPSASDPSGRFWTHFLLLQKYSRVAVHSDENDGEEEPRSSATNMTLCKFLLNLLTDKRSRDVIRWLNDEGEFEFVQPEVVAKMWSAFEPNSESTFEKLARALKRQNKIITAKGDDGEHIYRFDFDVREVLGYTPMELDKLLKEL